MQWHVEEDEFQGEGSVEMRWTRMTRVRNTKIGHSRQRAIMTLRLKCITLVPADQFLCIHRVIPLNPPRFRSASSEQHYPYLRTLRVLGESCTSHCVSSLLVTLAYEVDSGQRLLSTHLVRVVQHSPKSHYIVHRCRHRIARAAGRRGRTQHREQHIVLVRVSDMIVKGCCHDTYAIVQE